MDRRRFLKYAGATAAVVGASALGLDYFSQSRPPTSNQTATTTVSTSRFNFPPIAKFDVSPKYLNPTDQQTIQLRNLSTDVDGDPLTYEWLIDNQPVSTQKDYSTQLPVGDHLVQLNVSDGTAKNIATNKATNIVTVEPDQIYPTKPLQINLKGMRTAAGWNSPIPIEKVSEQLSTIHDELGCNAVIIVCNFGITGYFEDHLIEAGRLAVEKEFDRIYIAPMYLNASPNQTIDRLSGFAPKVRRLREMSESVVFMVGHEFGLDTHGIIPGNSHADRLRYQFQHDDWQGRVNAVIPSMFREIIDIVKQNYGYQITYAAAPWEKDLVPWSDPIFESIGINNYIRVYRTEASVLQIFSSMRRFGKPVNSTEWASMSFKGASTSALTELDSEDYPYDEDEQATYIDRYCRMLNKARINGCFYTHYNDERPKGYGLYNGMERKKGFYMYKSYQRVS